MRMWYTVHAEARLASRPVVGRRESVGLVHSRYGRGSTSYKFLYSFMLSAHTHLAKETSTQTHSLHHSYDWQTPHSFWLRDRLCCTWRVASKSLLSAYSKVQRCALRLIVLSTQSPPPLPTSFHLPVSHVAAHVTCRVTRWMSTGHTASLPDTVSCTSTCLQTSQKPLALYPNTGGADRIKRETGNMAKKAWTLTTYPCATSWNVFWRFFLSFLRCFVCYWFFFLGAWRSSTSEREERENCLRYVSIRYKVNIYRLVFLAFFWIFLKNNVRKHFLALFCILLFKNKKCTFE